MTAPESEDLIAFIQIIEYRTTKLDELNAALDGWLEATKGRRAATRGGNGGTVLPEF